jgi:hypothetical protein
LLARRLCLAKWFKVLDCETIVSKELAIVSALSASKRDFLSLGFD